MQLSPGDSRLKEEKVCARMAQDMITCQSKGNSFMRAEVPMLKTAFTHKFWSSDQITDTGRDRS